MAETDKSEGYKDFPYDPIEQLERITTDEYLVGMNARADQVEEYLNTHNVGQQERSRLIEQLDRAWIHMNQKVAAWGTVYTPHDMVAPDVITYETENIKGVTMMSTGFMPLPFAAVLDDETIINYKIAYSFQGKDGHVGMLRDGFGGKFPDSGPAMAMRRFDYHYPDQATLIRQLADNIEQTPSATPVLNFANYEIVVDPWTTDGKEYIRDVQTYLYQVMNFDDKLPYFIKCELDESDDEQDSSVVEIIASPMQIRFISSNEEYISGSHRHIPCLDLKVHDVDRRKADTKLSVPIRSLIRFDSIRNAANGFNV